jgi:1,4-dihydroxy-6-naphthoate synthase
LSEGLRRLRIGHSPDPDDAFMVWALAEGRLTLPGWDVQLVPQDIQGLNQRARSGELEVTALSAGAFPQVADRYALLATGSSFGRGYGPIVITREPRDAAWLKAKRIAVPGEGTTAFLLLNLALDGYTPVQADFTAIMGMVQRGEVDAGLLIHEGQLTYGREGFHKALDLAAWWGQRTGLPLPLGLNAVRRDLGAEGMAQAAGLFLDSVKLGLANEDAAVAYALNFGRGLDHETGKAFVRQYVNQDTLDIRGECLQGLRRLYTLAVERGLLSQVPDLAVF